MYALPGLRQLFVRRLRLTGLNRELHELIEALRPDLVIAPSGGIDPLVIDAVRSARRLGIPSLVLVHNWDNLSSKGAFAVRPDYLGGVGRAERRARGADPRLRRASASAARRARVRRLLPPQPGLDDPPFPFRYALFAGCYAPFDERDARSSGSTRRSSATGST